MKKLLATTAAIVSAATVFAGTQTSDLSIFSGSYQFLSFNLPTLFYGIVIPQPFIIGAIPTTPYREITLKQVVLDGDLYYQYPDGSLSLAPSGTTYSSAPIVIAQPVPWYFRTWNSWWNWNPPPPPPRPDPPRPRPPRPDPPRPRPPRPDPPRPDPPRPDPPKPRPPRPDPPKPVQSKDHQRVIRPIGKAVTPRPAPRDDRYRPTDFVRAGQTQRPGDAFRPGDGYKPSDNFNSPNSPGAGPRPGDGYKPSNSFRSGGFRPGDGYRPSSIYRRNR